MNDEMNNAPANDQAAPATPVDAEEKKTDEETVAQEGETPAAPVAEEKKEEGSDEAVA